MTDTITRGDIAWLLALLSEHPSEDVIHAVAEARILRKKGTPDQFPEALDIVRRLVNLQSIPE
jgi:hypothetical protein